MAGEGRRLSRSGRRSMDAVAVRMTASMKSPSTASVSELCPPLLNRARDRSVLDIGPSRRPGSTAHDLDRPTRSLECFHQKYCMSDTSDPAAISFCPICSTAQRHVASISGFFPPYDLSDFLFVAAACRH